MPYQMPKNRDLGINSCQDCLDKLREIDRLKAEVQRLKAALHYRDRKREDGPFGSSTPSSLIPLKPNSKEENINKKGGAKFGHKGHGRKSLTPQQADRIEEVSVDRTCPHCGDALVSKGRRSRTVIDIDPVEVKKIIYRLERKLCPGCGCTLQAKPPSVLPHSALGNQLMAELLESHYLQGVPLGRLCVKFNLNPSTVISAFHRVGKLFEPAYKELITEYRNSLVRHADETRWRTDGESNYCWLFCTTKLSIYLFGRSRSSSVVKEVMGVEALKGWLVVDRYAAYNRAPCRLQYCYAHLMREVEDLAKEFAEEEEVKLFTSTLIPLLSEAQHLRRQAISDRQYLRRARELKEKIIEVNLSPALHLGIRKIQNIFLDNSERLYHWAEDRRVPAENNLSERELRPTVIARKVSFGSQSEEGAKTRGILMSIFHSLRKSVGEPKKRIKEALDLLASDGKVEIYKALFGNDSS